MHNCIHVITDGTGIIQATKTCPNAAKDNSLLPISQCFQCKKPVRSVHQADRTVAISTAADAVSTYQLNYALSQPLCTGYTGSGDI